MDEPPPDAPPEDADRRLQTMLDRVRSDALVSERIRERWLLQQATEQTALRGLLVDIARRAVPVTVRTATGRTHRGMVVAVGADFCTVRAGRAPDVHLALRAVTTVGPRPGHRLSGPAAGARPEEADLQLHELLARAVADRPGVRCVLADGGEGLTGTLEGVGVDVLVLSRSAGERLYVAGASLEAVSFLPSG
jgi:hypothetical protein